MKRFNKRSLVASVALALALASGLTGCVTNQQKTQALVCPGCKMVEVTEGSTSLADDYSNPTTSAYMVHTCPNCQGALKTLFKEGKLQHKCSVCAEDAYTCPVSHRWF